MQINENITLIEGTGHNSNCYIIRGKINVLVDTGTRYNFECLKKHIKKKVDLIINTHCHYDHIGCNALLKREYGAKLAAHSLDAKYISSGNARHTCSVIFQEELKTITVDMLVKDNDTIEDTDLVVIHTPGHTEGGICLYDKKDKILFSGDTIFANGGIGRTDLPGGDHAILVSSIEALSKLDVKIILPGHGEPVLSNGSEYIKEILRRETIF